MARLRAINRSKRGTSNAERRTPEVGFGMRVHAGNRTRLLSERMFSQQDLTTGTLPACSHSAFDVRRWAFASALKGDLHPKIFHQKRPLIGHIFDNF